MRPSSPPQCSLLRPLDKTFYLKFFAMYRPESRSISPDNLWRLEHFVSTFFFNLLPSFFSIFYHCMYYSESYLPPLATLYCSFGVLRRSHFIVFDHKLRACTSTLIKPTSGMT
ncbi:hypothetical protein BDV98DRAFT_3498 [Pterulicium gracile]|uniref:Uncharacterized protein n=1 Tax=Pterulicium gracile TaxID=1884261 RepID=A0A5C3R1F2_9AGAR|nr:hypothetical protein BDV98DRAFT_3498 [Pterula gracilis]